jgi:hypothetical protein
MSTPLYALSLCERAARHMKRIDLQKYGMDTLQFLPAAIVVRARRVMSIAGRAVPKSNQSTQRGS